MYRTSLCMFTLVSICIATTGSFGGDGGVPINSFGSNSETMGSIGLRFDFGDMTPQIVGQLRHTKTDSGNDVVGALGEVAFPLLGEKPFIPTVRAMGLVGTPDVQGMAGIGYDFASRQPLLGLGVQGPFVEGGFNVELGGEFHPYLGVNSYDGAPDRKVVSVPFL